MGHGARCRLRGSDAITTFQDSSRSGLRFSCALLDMEMHDVTGLELASFASFSSPTPPARIILMLPSPLDSHSSAECKRLGISTISSRSGAQLFAKRCSRKNLHPRRWCEPAVRFSAGYFPPYSACRRQSREPTTDIAHLGKNRPHRCSRQRWRLCSSSAFTAENLTWSPWTCRCPVWMDSKPLPKYALKKEKRCNTFL